MNQQASVNVARFEIECRLSEGMRNSAGVNQRFHRIARTVLAGALEEYLQPLDAGSEAVVLIKSLQLDIDLDITLSEREIAQRWAKHIKRLLIKAMAKNNSSALMVFDSQAHYLAAALLDIARGRARQLWYYRRFDGLWALPLSAAIRTAILDDPEIGLAALTTCNDGEILELCAALSKADAARILVKLFSFDPDILPGTDAAEIFMDRLGADYSVLAGTGAQLYQDALFLTVKTSRQLKDSDTAVFAACARLFALLYQIKIQHQQLFPQIVERFRAGQLAAVREWLPAEMLTDLVPLVSATPEVLRILVQPLVSEFSSQALQQDGQAMPNHFTWFGNAMLLLPHIHVLPLAQFDRWQEYKSHQPVTVMRWLVLCVCQGKDRFPAATADPLLRDLCGVKSSLNLTDLFSWLNEHLSSDESIRLFDALRGQALPENSRRQWFQFEAGSNQTRVLAETRKGCWLSMLTGNEELALDAIPRCNDDEQQRLVKGDFECLDLGRTVQVDPRVRASLLVLAQFTLKTFAYRLPGFANCSVEYLLRNFLSMSATLVAEDDHIVAHLSRVPMSVILNMTGISRERLELAEFDRRPIRLAEGR